MKRQRISVAGAVLCALFLSFSVVNVVRAQTAESGPAPAKSTSNYEIDFMTGMIDHHMMAVQMGQMCLEKAVHEELLAMCQDIIATQTQEIEQMQAWLTEWYGVSYAPEMKPGAMKRMEKMAELSPEAFEIEFMEMMIKHHMGAIREASKCVERVYHEELHDLCENIIVTQAAEIEQMRAWLCEWYQICK